MAPITWLRAVLGLRMRPGGTDGEHPAQADLGGRGIDGDLDEVGAEGRLLIALLEVAEFDPVLGDEIAGTRGFGEGDTAIAQSDAAVGEGEVGGGKAEPLRHGLAQLDAGGIDAGGRAVGAPLPA